MSDLIRVCPTIPEGSAARDQWIERTAEDGAPYLEQVVSPLTVLEVRSARLNAINQLRDDHLAATYQYPGNADPAIPAFPMASKPIDVANWTGLGTTCIGMISLGQPNAPVTLEPDDGVPGSTVTLTATTALTVLAAYGARQQAIRARAIALASEVSAADSAEAVLAIDLSAGWPA